MQWLRSSIHIYKILTFSMAFKHVYGIKKIGTYLLLMNRMGRRQMNMYNHNGTMVVKIWDLSKCSIGGDTLGTSTESEMSAKQQEIVCANKKKLEAKKKKKRTRVPKWYIPRSVNS
ncbi:hypothetical protein U1Q18_004798 [Sarracenia purpurea var. burkii]